MATWASRRKTFYATLFISGAVLLFGIPLFLALYESPTCFDGLQNGRETGVDCGGKCARICPAQFLKPVVTWSRSHKIAEGVYNLGAYVENPNIDASASNIPYIFRVFDAKGIPIIERTGTTYIPPHKNIVVFENGVRTGERIPSRIIFEFTKEIPWEKTVSGEELLLVADRKLSEDGRPRLEAEIHNTNVDAFSDIDVFAVLYDIDENVVAFSKTKIDRLAPNQKEKVVFTWPLPFSTGVTTIEVIPTVVQ